MIKYTERSMAVTKDGFYLVQVESEDTTELVIAEATLYGDGEVSWGQDWDVWGSDSDLYTLTVICDFDLEVIAESVKRINDGVEQEDSVSVDRSLLDAACRELRAWKVDKGGDDQVVLNLEATLRLRST